MSRKTLSVDQTLGKAKTLARKGEFDQAMQLYLAVLERFPGNRRASDGLKSLTRPNHDQGRRVSDSGPDQGQIDGLAALFKQGRLQEALEQGTALAKRYPDAPLILNILGAANAEAGRLDEAAAVYSRVLKLNPDYAQAHYNLGNVLIALGRHEAAIASYSRAAELKPDYTEAHNNLGSALCHLGRNQEALVSLNRALQLKPDHAEAHNNLGNALKTLRRDEEAFASLTKALQIRPDYAEALNNLGCVLNNLGRHDEAIANVTKALKLNPDYAEAHNNLALAFDNLGRHDEAVASLTKAVQLKPDYNEALRNLGNLKKYELNDPQIAQMQRQITDPSISENDKLHLSFALGKAYDDIGDVERAFPHLVEGNRLRKKELGYDISHDRRLFSRIRSIFAADKLPTPEGTGPATGHEKHPVFIVGMPRSGTTLAEQILASHPQVYGAGELDIMGKIVAPICLGTGKNHSGKITTDTFRDIRSRYLNGLAGFGGIEPYITDKLPLNFMWIGFILTAMPEAKIINLQRDPVATCWSVFKHYFTGTGNGYAYDLADVSEFYKLYIDLMEFWRTTFPNRIYDLDYEALTENPEEQTRELLEYCGLGWDARCLEFHKTKRAVKTASSLQVRQAMYKGSSEAWRKYETHLQPMIQALKA